MKYLIKVNNFNKKYRTEEVKIKDIEAAQRKMLDVAQKMIEEGTIDRDMDE